MWFAAVFISQVSEKIYGSVSVDTLLYEHVHYMCMSSESFFELKKIPSFKAVCELWSPVLTLVLKYFKGGKECDPAPVTAWILSLMETVRGRWLF